MSAATRKRGLTGEALVTPVVIALVNVLATMAGTAADPESPRRKRGHRARGSVSGMIAMNCERGHGSLAITFSKKAITGIYRAMVGESPGSQQPIAPELADLAGEITNMVAGGANRLLAEQGFDVAMATPHMKIGASHTLHHRVSGDTLLIPLITPHGKLFIEVCAGP